jgi:hypothetical protein
MNIKNTLMNQEEIKQLLDKYYNGETTSEEELLLKKFFSQQNIPEELRDEKSIFSFYMKAGALPKPSADFDKRILSALDMVDNISLSFKRRKIFGIITGVAAGMLILAGTYFFLIRKSEPRDTFTDPEIAYAETMKILYDVSSRLNHGTQALEPIGALQLETQKSFKTINKSTSIFKEKIRPLDNLLKTMEHIDPAGKRNNKQIITNH